MKRKLIFDDFFQGGNALFEAGNAVISLFHLDVCFVQVLTVQTGSCR
jgi:hypothetical protein